MKKTTVLILTLATIFSVANSQNPYREIKQIVVSEQLPNIQIEVDPLLTYVGKVSFNVDTIGVAEEYIFSEIHDGKMKRILIVHFEQFLSANGLKFNYPRFRMKKIGAYEYLHQIFYVKDFTLLQTKELVDLFKNKGLDYESNWMLNRYVRAVDKELKYEMILFYLEPGSSFSEEIRDEAEKSDPRDISMTHWQQEFSKRALDSFRILKD